MKTTHLAALACVCAALALAACGKSDTAAPAGTAPAPNSPVAATPAAPTHESIRARALTQSVSLNAILQSVKDEASAQAAVPKIEAVGKEFAALKAQDDALPKLSTEEDTALAQKLAPQAKPYVDGISTEMKRITILPPNVSAPVLAAMDAVGKQMP